ncbi:hypothetical protein GJ496_006745 [Pomphorhynchus laevis]|nr:hypothetical protein GJ496_006745 [Pomphorhynchus laevis]
MGVPGLWKLLKDCAVTIRPKTLAGKRLAIDVSLLLHKFAKARRHRNAHIHAIFTLCCKLLHYGILPVFVFDGRSPAIKQRIMKERRKRTLNKIAKVDAVQAAIRSKKLKALLYQNMSSGITEDDQAMIDNSNSDEDMFDLDLDTHQGDFGSWSNSDYSSDSNERVDNIMLDTPKRYLAADDLPKDGGDFSNFQISRLLSFAKLAKSKISEEHCSKTVLSPSIDEMNIKSIRRHASNECCYSVYYQQPLHKRPSDELPDQLPAKISKPDTNESSDMLYEQSIDLDCPDIEPIVRLSTVDASSFEISQSDTEEQQQFVENKELPAIESDSKLRDVEENTIDVDCSASTPCLQFDQAKSFLDSEKVCTPETNFDLTLNTSANQLTINPLISNEDEVCHNLNTIASDMSIIDDCSSKDEEDEEDSDEDFIDVPMLEESSTHLTSDSGQHDDDDDVKSVYSKRDIVICYLKDKHF